MRGLFVTGTDTGVGKTVLAAAIVAALRAQRRAVAVLKPVLTGLDEATDSRWPHDHELLARTAGCRPEQVVTYGYGSPVSPHLAAQLAGCPIDPELLTGAASSAAAGRELLVVEGVGGLLVPLADGYDVRDLARELGLPLVVAARPGLGTINHTLLTLAAAHQAGLRVLAVVLTPWPDAPDAVARSNLETIARLGEVDVAVLPRVAHPDPGPLAAAAAALPIERWLSAEPSLT